MGTFLSLFSFIKSLNIDLKCSRRTWPIGEENPSCLAWIFLKAPFVCWSPPTPFPAFCLCCSSPSDPSLGSYALARQYGAIIFTCSTMVWKSSLFNQNIFSASSLTPNWKMLLITQNLAHISTPRGGCLFSLGQRSINFFCKVRHRKICKWMGMIMFQ